MMTFLRKILYNLPNDHHMSDYGVKIYSRSMATVLSNELTGVSEDFSHTDST